MSQLSAGRKKVLINGVIPGKRIVSLRTYRVENMVDRRGILFSIFKSELEERERVEQVVNVLLDLTVAVEKNKKSIDYR